MDYRRYQVFCLIFAFKQLFWIFYGLWIIDAWIHKYRLICHESYMGLSMRYTWFLMQWSSMRLRMGCYTWIMYSFTYELSLMDDVFTYGFYKSWLVHACPIHETYVWCHACFVYGTFDSQFQTFWLLAFAVFAAFFLDGKFPVYTHTHNTQKNSYYM